MNGFFACLVVILLPFFDKPICDFRAMVSHKQAVFWQTEFAREKQSLKNT
jgi:hypothetical protein